MAKDKTTNKSGAGSTAKAPTLIATSVRPGSDVAGFGWRRIPLAPPNAMYLPGMIQGAMEDAMRERGESLGVFVAAAIEYYLIGLGFWSADDSAAIAENAARSAAGRQSHMVQQESERRRIEADAAARADFDREIANIVHAAKTGDLALSTSALRRLPALAKARGFTLAKCLRMVAGQLKHDDQREQLRNHVNWAAARDVPELVEALPSLEPEPGGVVAQTARRAFATLPFVGRGGRDQSSVTSAE